MQRSSAFIGGPNRFFAHRLDAQPFPVCMGTAFGILGHVGEIATSVVYT
jgi:hypothetical protein